MKNITTEITKAPLDTVANIRHITLADVPAGKYHVAEVSDYVQAHYHKFGKEFYHVIDGSGEMFLGEVKEGIVNWNKRFFVSKNDVFVIPEMTAHHLFVSDKNKPITLAFICSDEHLGADRYVVENPKK